MLTRRLASFGYAWEGIRYVMRTQPNWRIHVALAALAIALGLVLRIPPAELALLALTIGLVLALECVNTAVESAIDAQGGSPSFAAKCAKDTAAAGVLVGAATAVMVAIIVFAPRLLGLTS